MGGALWERVGEVPARDAGAPGGFRVRRMAVELPEFSLVWSPSRPRAGEKVRVEVAGLAAEGEPYAELLARTMRARFDTVWGVAETGAAGPTGNRYGDDAGHTCVAVSGPVSAVKTIETGSNDREANMQAFTDAALDLFAACLAEASH